MKDIPIYYHVQRHQHKLVIISINNRRSNFIVGGMYLQGRVIRY